MIKTVGVVGLGLIGGSMAKAIHAFTDCTLYGYDADGAVLSRAMEDGVLSGVLTPEGLAGCDLVIVALYPEATVDYITRNRTFFRKSGLVMDCGGVKTIVCEPLEPVARESGFHFIGGHPMAGIERSGFNFSSEKIFEGATMILTPFRGTDIADVDRLSQFFKSIGFARMQVATDAEHDQMIAYTSQLAHVVSSAYIKSELSPNFKGFSAGSFHDMTRVAKLNETMWTELFLVNKDYLADEIDGLVERLQAYSKVIRNGDGDTLKAMLKDGKEKRLAVDVVKEFD